MLGSSYKVEDTKSTVKSLFAIPWTVAYPAPPSMEFSRQECWSGLPFPSPEDLPDPGIEPWSPPLQADAFTVWATREASKGKMDSCISSMQMACRFGACIKQFQGHRLRDCSWTLCHQLHLQQCYPPWLHIFSAVSSPSPSLSLLWNLYLNSERQQPVWKTVWCDLRTSLQLQKVFSTLNYFTYHYFIKRSLTVLFFFC